MNKKAFIVGVSVFLLASSLAIAQVVEFDDRDRDRGREKELIYQHLNWAYTGYGEMILDTRLDSPDTYSFESSPFITFSVPPSPKAEALFFELWGQSHHYWHIGYFPQKFYAHAKMNIVSDLIPDGINVYLINTLTEIFGISHESLQRDRNKATGKFIMRRDSLLREYPDWWYVRYDDGTVVPGELAQSILNSLMDNGFDVELSVAGYAECVRRFFFYAFQVEVTRLVKKE